MVEHRGPCQLSREVLPPQPSMGGFGVAVVAAVAMLFAVASSAFIVRARMVKRTCPGMTAPAAPQWSVGADATEHTPCGQASQYANPDGSIIVVFKACPKDDPRSDLTSVRSAEPASIEVRRIQR